MQELLFKSILNPLPASETANAQRLLMCTETANA
jgi:hypothetical protein